MFAQCGCSNVHAMQWWLWPSTRTWAYSDLTEWPAFPAPPTYKHSKQEYNHSWSFSIVVPRSSCAWKFYFNFTHGKQNHRVSSQEVSEWWASLAKPVACQGFPFPIFLYHTLSCVSLRIIQRENQFKFSSSPTGWPRESLKARLLEVGGWPGIYRANPGLSLPPSQDETPQHCHRGTKSF